MATVRTYQVTIHGEQGAPLAFKSFDVPTSNDDDLDREDKIGAERAAEVAIELIREQGSLSPGERVVVTAVRDSRPAAPLPSRDALHRKPPA